MPAQAAAAKITAHPFIQGVHAQDDAIKMVETLPAHKTTPQANATFGIRFYRVRYLR
jgi:hypothetical protein